MNRLIENAKYNKSKHSDDNASISCVMGGRQVCVPMSEDNTDYQEILKQVADKDIKLKIKEAD